MHPAQRSDTVADPELAARYMAAGWWGNDTPTDLLRRHAADRPDDIAYITWYPRSKPGSEGVGDVERYQQRGVSESGGSGSEESGTVERYQQRGVSGSGGQGSEESGTVERITWAGYDRLSDRVAAALLAAGLNRGDRVAVILPDSAAVHAAFTGADKAGVVVMGIGYRAGPAELVHLVSKAGARAIITGSDHRGRPAADLMAELRPNLPDLAHHIVVDGLGAGASITLDGRPAPPPESVPNFGEAIEERRLGASELCLLNSTSGTTGLPKCVMQTHNRWFYFHRKAVEYGGLGPGEVFCVPVPAPFGFGLWTAHYTPTILGAPTVVMTDFDAAALIRLIEAERVTVLCAVTTQFIMMLNSPALEHHDLSSLRVMFTGGEAIPYRRAAEFEDRTGCTVLNFYGSNETGMLSGTRLSDPRGARLGSGGRCEPEMNCRLYDPDSGQPRPELRGRGRPACRGPATALGYYDDPEANAALVTGDGWMLMGDIVEIDGDGYLRVVGRTSDFIIRGGKNISALAVEDEVMAHPAVGVVAVVAVPDPVFGERVAAYVEPVPGADLDLDGLREHLAARGVSREWWPEYLFVLDALPRSSGGKVAKGRLREDAARRVAGGAD
ncbi:class I adenylate-forming enzyme family protein [Candidatus Poriferisocius sp.]|uniref:class I adenylate-forming enzyme family protein n=1 Tax=Candidatus Poriferisocius sp. TaxID=3101276 RepID=UPI003B0271BE